MSATPLPPEAVPCRRCYKEPGEPCRGHGGQVRTHQVRLRDAAATERMVGAWLRGGAA